MLVTSTDRVFAEKGARALEWLPFEAAARRVAEPGLRKLLLVFARLQRAA